MNLFRLNDINNNRNPELNWISWFKQDNKFNGYRFKYYTGDEPTSGPYFDFIEEWIDFVDDINEYYAFEKDRVPLFVGSEVGLIPSLLSDKGVKLQSPIIAVLKKALIKNHIIGLGFYSLNLKQQNIKAFVNKNELIFFSNSEFVERKNI